MILRCRRIQKPSGRTIAKTTAAAIFGPRQPFLAEFVIFVPIVCAVRTI